MPDDVAVMAALIDGFAKGHPAEGYARSVDRMRDAFFGDQPMAHILLAEKNAVALGFAAWRMTYDWFWSLNGGEGVGLYVIPSQRGRGVAVCLIAAMCSAIREHGGHFLESSYDPDLGRLYERVGVGRPARTCHVSARAFERLACLSGRTAREIVRALPDKALN
jgi:GNAT superfamily N-acetyltransferase